MGTIERLGDQLREQEPQESPAADASVVAELQRQLETLAGERSSARAELEKKAGKLGALVEQLEQQDGRIASLTEQLEGAQTEVEGLQFILAARESGGPPTPAQPVAPVAASAPVGGGLGAAGPELDALTARIAELRETTEAGRERWKGVEMAVGRATQELLKLAGKEPTLQQTLYSMLPDLQQALDGGREVVSGAADGSDASQQALDALKASLPSS